MVVRVVRLGSARTEGKGIRIGAVRRPPRGAPKSEFATRNWHDVWFATLAPSVETMKVAQTTTIPAQWSEFGRKYRAEMETPANRHAVGLLEALSHQTDFSVGCYCADETRCHRSILRALLGEAGAQVE